MRAGHNGGDARRLQPRTAALRPRDGGRLNLTCVPAQSTIRFRLIEANRCQLAAYAPTMR